ncbi:GNAT family N-acetyltransferase [Lacisediminihabitans sp.]|uniref:GNAT family N-acetyltransferase n=1 Tax=Lacisediminihabitans sp. TaxID=2787631 RepID=UPI00374CCF62
MEFPQSDRLTFRKMTDDDLDEMAGLLGDPGVMAYYPRPKSVGEAQAWIDWNTSNYEKHGFGLWIIETRSGQFVGDCGLTWQAVNGRPELEVGYHVRPESQGLGYATEAAAACRDFARDVLKAPHLVAIIHPDNVPSRRVAEKIGLQFEEDDHGGSIAVRSVYGSEL